MPKTKHSECSRLLIKVFVKNVRKFIEFYDELAIGCCQYDAGEA